MAYFLLNYCFDRFLRNSECRGSRHVPNLTPKEPVRTGFEVFTAPEIQGLGRPIRV